MSNSMLITPTKPLDRSKNNYLRPQYNTITANSQIDGQKTTTSPLESQRFNNKWLDDTYIDAYVKCFEQEISKVRSDVLIISPIITHNLKYGNLYDVTNAMTNLEFEQKNFTILCVSNCVEHYQPTKKYSQEDFNKRGSHWSLLIYSKSDHTVFHLDSLKGLNHKAAKQLTSNIGFEANFVEVSVSQQSSNFECGVHLLVNLKYIMTQYFEKCRDISFCHFINENYGVGKKKSAEAYTPTYHQVKPLPKPIRDSYVFEPLELVNRKCALQPFHYSSNENHLTGQTNHENSKESIKSKQLNDKCAPATNNPDLNYVEKALYEQNQTHIRKSFKTLNKISSTGSFEIKTKNRFECLKESMNIDENNDDKQYASDEKSNPPKIDGPIKTKYYKTKVYSCRSSDKLKISRTKLSSSQSTKREDQTCRSNKLHIISDSHGKQLDSLLKDSLKEYSVTSEVYPGVTLKFLSSKVNQASKLLTIDDTLLVIGGTNDIIQNSVSNIIPAMKSILLNENATKVILAEIPYRYDKPNLNKIIRRTNMDMKNELVCHENFNHSLLSLKKLREGDYTRHGLHLNMTGKHRLCHIIKEHLILHDDIQEQKIFRCTSQINSQTNNSKPTLARNKDAKKKKPLRQEDKFEHHDFDNSICAQPLLNNRTSPPATAKVRGGEQSLEDFFNEHIHFYMLLKTTSESNLINANNHITNPEVVNKALHDNTKKGMESIHFLGLSQQNNKIK